jgi:hypothetical protein
MDDDEEETFPISLVAMCRSEDDAARVIETFSRAIAGLVLEGIGIMIMRPPNDP